MAEHKGIDIAYERRPKRLAPTDVLPDFCSAETLLRVLVLAILLSLVAWLGPTPASASETPRFFAGETEKIQSVGLVRPLRHGPAGSVRARLSRYTYMRSANPGVSGDRVGYTFGLQRDFLVKTGI